MGEDLTADNDNKEHEVELGRFLFDEGIDLSEILEAPSGQIIHAPWGPFLFYRE